ncbi:hypothetical protein KAI52_03815 [Candidatus Parcubacteria bacterium]|nr:hypothetical protein [Candidatus Parcubacteria bacterium]
MLETSKDLLFIVLSFSVLLLTFCFVWLFYYLIKIIRDISSSIDKINDITKKIDDLVKLVKDKLGSSASHLFMIGEMIKSVMNYINKKQENKKCGNKKMK